MDTVKKMVLTTLVIAAVAFVAAPNGPVGQALWPEPKHDVVPTSAQLPFFIVLGALEAIAFGFGVAFWTFGRDWSRQTFGPGALGLWAHLAVGFLTANFWLHDNLHIINGMDMAGIAVIDYLFHVPLMACGVILVMAAAKRTRTDATATATGRVVRA